MFFISFVHSSNCGLSSRAWYRFSKYWAMCSFASSGSSMGFPFSSSVMYESPLCLGVIFLFSFQKSCDFVPPSLVILLANVLMFCLWSFSIFFLSLYWLWRYAFMSSCLLFLFFFVAVLKAFRFSFMSFLGFFTSLLSLPRFGRFVVIFTLPIVFSSMFFIFSSIWL